MQGIKWIFFDVGSTLVDETEAYNHRIREAEEILKYLKSLGYKIGVIANQSLGTAERLTQWGLLEYINVVAASAELGLAKPDAAIFQKAFELAGCTANEAVMIGDRLDNDIVPAKKLGMRAVWVKQGFNAYQDTSLIAPEYRPDAAIENLLELKIYFNDILTGYTIPVGSQEYYKYVVVCSNYQGKWLLSRHKKRTTWETQGGHVEEGETSLEAAKRELYEESGVTDAEVYPVCDYRGFRGPRNSYGMVFLAVVHELGELPESEMQEVKLFEELPENLTYPKMTPILVKEAGKFYENLFM